LQEKFGFQFATIDLVLLEWVVSEAVPLENLRIVVSVALLCDFNVFNLLINNHSFVARVDQGHFELPRCGNTEARVSWFDSDPEEVYAFVVLVLAVKHNALRSGVQLDVVNLRSQSVLDLTGWEDSKLKLLALWFFDHDSLKHG
jgi:hypothetical protein